MKTKRNISGKQKSLGQVAHDAFTVHPWSQSYMRPAWHRVALAVVREYEKRRKATWSSSGLTEQDEQWERGKKKRGCTLEPCR